MNRPLILVTGATGKTGQNVAQEMLERGFPVRALARAHDERTKRLEELGADIVLGDFHDLRTMRAAVNGTQRVYFCYPPQGDRLVEATTILATATRDAGVENVVNISQISARPDSKSPLARHHWLSENILDWAGVGAMHLRPTFFAEMLLILGAATVEREGKLYLPYGDERHAPVAAADIARVAAGVLASPASHVGERYVVTGPHNMTLSEVAKVLSEELGRSIEYVDLPNESWGQALLGLGHPEFLVTHLQAVADDHKRGVFSAVTDVVERIGGRAPQSPRAFIQANRKGFGAEAVQSHA